MCEPKCFGSFIIYIIIEYALIFICFITYRIEKHWSVLFIFTSYGFLTTMIISCILCSLKKIGLTFFYFTIQICQLIVFLLEIEHRWYELLFVTPLIFYFLLFLVYNRLKSHQEEEENNSDLYITRIGREMLPRPDPWTFQTQSSPNTIIELDRFNMNNATSLVSSQLPTYDEVMKRDSKVIIHIESDPEPPSYSEALVGEKCFPVVSV